MRHEKGSCSFNISSYFNVHFPPPVQTLYHQFRLVVGRLTLVARQLQNQTSCSVPYLHFTLKAGLVLRIFLACLILSRAKLSTDLSSSLCLNTYGTGIMAKNGSTGKMRRIERGVAKHRIRSQPGKRKGGERQVLGIRETLHFSMARNFFEFWYYSCTPAPSYT